MGSSFQPSVEPLYAIQAALIEYKEDILAIQHSLSDLFDETDQRISQLLTKKAEELENAKMTRTGRKYDGFRCNLCGNGMMLLILGDHTYCRTPGCNGTMERVRHPDDPELQNTVIRLQNELEEYRHFKTIYEKQKAELIGHLHVLSGDAIVAETNTSGVIGRLITILERYINDDVSGIISGGQNIEQNNIVAPATTEVGTVLDQDQISQGTRELSQQEIALQSMGVNNVDLSLCHEINRDAILKSVEHMFLRHPELRGQLFGIKCERMRKGTYAAYGPTSCGDFFGGTLFLNSDYFSNPKLNDDLREKSRLGWFTPNASTETVIKHELGHALHLEICSLDSGVKNGSIPSTTSYNQVVQQYIDDKHADQIVESACRELGIAFDSWEFSSALSRYGGSNYGEAIAEAVAEVEGNEFPRPLSLAIYNNLIKYKNDLHRR